MRIEQLTPWRLRLVAGGLAAAAYGIQAWAWPLRIEGDMDDYLGNYLQLFDRHPLLPWTLAYRTPVAGLVTGGTLDLGGRVLAEVLAGTLYVLAIVFWTTAADMFSRRAAVLLAVLLLCYPGFAGMFHEYGAEMVFGCAFAGWTLLFCRAYREPSAGRFALAGLGIALLAFIRPGNAVVGVFALAPLLLGIAWRRRLVLAAAAAAAVLAPIGLWVVHNGVVIGDYAFARGSDAIIPFYRAFLVDRIISPGNGAASRRLEAAVAAQLVTREPYRSYGITAKTVFDQPNARVHEDLMLLSDEVWGWDSAYATLRQAAVEAIRKHPGDYVSGVLDTVYGEMRGPYYRVERGPPEPPGQTVVVRGRRLPAPSQGMLIPGGQNIWISTPDHRIRQVWTSPTTYRFAFAHPEDRRRFDRFVERRTSLLRALRDGRAPNETLGKQLNRLSRWYPKPLYLVALGLVLLAYRRPRHVLALLVPPLAALSIVTLTAMGDPVELHYFLPEAPGFFFFFAGAAFWPRGRPVRDTEPSR